MSFTSVAEPKVETKDLMSSVVAFQFRLLSLI